jgi:hypothetical protein
VLNTIALGHVSMWGRGYFVRVFRRARRFEFPVCVFSTDGFVLTCFGGSSEKLRIYIVRM